MKEWNCDTTHAGAQLAFLSPIEQTCACPFIESGEGYFPLKWQKEDSWGVWRFVSFGVVLVVTDWDLMWSPWASGCSWEICHKAHFSGIIFPFPTEYQLLGEREVCRGNENALIKASESLPRAGPAVQQKRQAVGTELSQGKRKKPWAIGGWW